MKIAISGKGGVGKTTVAALLAHGFAEEGRRVIAVDADPDANLGSALGLPPETLEKIVPIARMEDLIYERTGARPGTFGQWFVMNPKVDDIPERCSVKIDGVWLLVMGGVARGGGGCACPENTVLRTLLNHLVLEGGDVVILDMEAGLEHLGRGTARAVDAFLAVVEPGRRSFHTAADVIRLARDLGVRKVFGVANKAGPGEIPLMQAQAEAIGLELLGRIPYDPSLVLADAQGRPAWEASDVVVRAAEEIRKRLLDRIP